VDRIAKLVLIAALASASVTAWAQMGGPNAPTRIPNDQLDPARNLTSAALESARHTPLPEQYIWTKADSVATQPRVANDRKTWKHKDLSPHYFRRTFQMSSVPARATLYLVGPRQADIYLNGKKIGSDQLNLDSPIDVRVYSTDVTHRLRAGKNVLAIDAMRGPDHGSGASTRLELNWAHGEALAAMIIPALRGIQAAPLVMSDADWKATMEAQPSGWQQPDFNDASWPAADDLSGIEGSIDLFQWNRDAGMYAWPGYDGISPFLAHYLLKATDVSHVYGGVGAIENAQSLEAGSTDGALTVTLPKEHVQLSDAPQILLDFGREVTGRLELVSDSDQPVEVTVQYGESEAEAIQQPYLGMDPIYLPPHGTAYGPKSAFRYAIVRFVMGRDARFRTIRLDGIAYPVNYKGSFESSDPELNKIWTIGAYTAHLCMQDDIWDAPKRDRGRWMGDLDVTGRTINDVFLDSFLMEDTLNRLIGPEPVDHHVNGISGYSALWVTGEKQFYLHTGSMKQIESVHSRLVQLLDYMEKDLNDQNLFSDKTRARAFVDWSPEMFSYDTQTRMGTHFEYYAAFRDGAWLLRVLGDKQNASRMEAKADALKAAAQQSMLDEQGSFGDRWQPNAYAVFSGLATPDQYATIWKNSLSNVGHIEHNPFPITPYYNFYVISAMARMEHRQEALNWIRQYWGGMVDEGATSFWEGYDPSWPKGDKFQQSLQADNTSGFRVSLAHGWSSGVTPWLMSQVLGIEPTAGGFAKVNIRPDLLDLKWANGAEPTPHGLLGVSITNTDGYKVTITLPADVEASISVPVTSAGALVLVNGNVQRSTRAENGKRAVVVLKGKGTYVITAH
jgi:hypothetical protein